MKRISAIGLMIFVCSTNLFARDQFVEVIGRRPAGEGAADLVSFGGGNPTGGSSGARGGGIGGTGGSSTSGSAKVGELSKGQPVKDDVGSIIGKILSFAAKDFDASGEIWVKIETPDGYKIEVRITAAGRVTGRK